MKKIIGVVVGTMLAATACTSAGSDDREDKKDAAAKAAAKQLTRDATTVKPAWTVKQKMLGQPEVVGRTAVAIVKARQNELDLIGVDTATGTVTWKHPYSPGAQAPGYALSPVISQDKNGTASVVLLEPPRPLSLDNPGYWLTPIVALDPATGKERFRTRNVLAAVPLEECDDEVDACLRASYGSGTDYQNLRLDLETGRLAVDRDGLAANRRSIADGGLFSTDDRPGELIGVERDGKTLWTTPVEELAGKHHTSDTGWSVDWDEKTDRYTGYIGIGMPKTVKDRAAAGKSYDFDLAWRTQISFDGRTGELIWRKDGVRKPCLGEGDDSDDSDNATRDPVRCAVSGTLHFVKGKLRTPSGTSVTVQGYDPVTGRTRWSAPLDQDAAHAFLQGDNADLTTAPGTLVVPTAKGPRLYEARTGTSVAMATDDLFACEGKTATIKYVIPFDAGGENENRERYGDPMIEQCGPDGTVVDRPMTVATVKDSAQKVDSSTYVLSRSSGLVGYTLPKG
ncbi:PQQ-binding-like beta-propeller repeat protein [Aeromicrobium sp. S22]|uniref:PQQ-binding-like beta-propeller repeat protein n=1 Tax=Aeromicrobium sp. S22 TaxID=2662029 RepID=UPI00129E94B9|nr:PQQ-binding-like beta-propeller repeat protein [Aeromicrobium sp. S22]MRK01497.1 PQQ-binding-like beta-propeller repeat protein [Aeromicrobium sp. S22]